MITATIDARENRDVMTADVPNAFIQTELPKIDGEDRIVMKITGALVNMLIQIDLSLYKEYVVFEKGNTVICVELLQDSTAC